jgi:hypothetical protein
VIEVPDNAAPSGIRSGQTLVLKEGGVLGSNFTAGWGSTVRIAGGQVGRHFEAVGADITVSGGSIDAFFDAFNRTVVNINGGSIGFSNDGSIGSSNVYGGAVISVSGGSIAGLDAYDGSVVNLFGGAVLAIDANDGSVVNISGGSLNDLDSFDGSVINLFGGMFRLNDADIADTLSFNERFILRDRGVVLSGVLADGSAFAFELNSVFRQGQDFFHPDATLTVTLVAPGDANGDGLVNIDDLNAVRNNFGITGPADGSLTGDAFPFDGLVNIDDLNAVRNYFGRGPAPVPEPGGITMALGLLIVAGGWRWMARRSPCRSPLASRPIQD